MPNTSGHTFSKSWHISSSGYNLKAITIDLESMMVIERWAVDAGKTMKKGKDKTADKTKDKRAKRKGTKKVNGGENLGKVGGKSKKAATVDAGNKRRRKPKPSQK
jgi:hypothetical protein